MFCSYLAFMVILLNICSGGNIINVTGSNFDYIQRPQLILYIDSNVNVTVVSGLCMIIVLMVTVLSKHLNAWCTLLQLCWLGEHLGQICTCTCTCIYTWWMLTLLLTWLFLLHCLIFDAICLPIRALSERGQADHLAWTSA